MQLPKLKRRQIANFIGFLLILLTVSVAVIGFITTRNLSSVVESLEEDADPNNNLLLYKEIMLVLYSMENKVESYQLTNDQSYLNKYNESISTVAAYIDTLNRLNPKDEELLSFNDSLANLVNQKTDLLNEMIHLDRARVDHELSNLKKRIESLPQIVDEIQNTTPDTTSNRIKEKPGFFKRLFSSKSDETKENKILDSTEYARLSAKANQYQHLLQQELQQLEESTYQSNQSNKNKLIAIESAHAQIQNQIMDLISFLESRETVKMRINSLRAKELASATRQQIITFGTLMIILLLSTTIIMISYVQKNKKYQSLLRNSKKAAEVLAKAKERFFANMSHELRTPMNAISGFTKILMKSRLNEEQREQVDIIHSSSEHLLKLLNDILDFSKLQANKLQLESRVFSIRKVCEDSCWIVQKSADEKSLELRVGYKNLPEYVEGDPHRLKQILLNLLTNAIKFTEEGSVSLQIDAQQTQDKVLLVIKITDTGIGIPLEKQHLLFQEFEQADQSSFSKGTGLGLAITKRLVNLHEKGKIVLKSKEKSGTTVKVEMKYPISKEVPKKENNPKTPDIPQLKILIADDEPFNIKLLATLLKNRGIEFDQAEDGQQAITLLNKYVYDLALLDLKMPYKSGWEVVDEIKNNEGPNQQTPFVALTATISGIDKNKSKQKGFHTILRKPFDELELFEIIGELSGVAQQKKDERKVANLDITSLKQMGDDAFVLEMIETFIKSAEDGILVMKEAVQSKDFQKLSLTAHRIVSPARHFKAKQLIDLLKSIEQRADAEDDSLDLQDVEAAEKELELTISTLKELDITEQ